MFGGRIHSRCTSRTNDKTPQQGSMGGPTSLTRMGGGGGEQVGVGFTKNQVRQGRGGGGGRRRQGGGRGGTEEQGAILFSFQTATGCPLLSARI